MPAQGLRVRVARQRGWLTAAVVYAAIGVAVLGTHVRPGYTVVPTDTLTQMQPYRAYAGGYRADNFLLGDPATQFFPWVDFLDSEIDRGRLPTWNPYVLLGVPVTPNGYVGAYYPAVWALRWLSPFAFYNAFVLVHLVLGALGVYALSRVVGASWRSSLIAGAASYAAAFWIHWSLHLGHLVALVGIPWVLCAAIRAVGRADARGAAALAVVVALWAVGGNPQYVYYGALAAAGVVVWSCARVVRDSGLAAIRAPAIAVTVGGALGLAVAAPVLLPSISTAPGILRQAESSAALSASHLPARHVVRTVVPDAVGSPADGFIYSATAEEAMDSPSIGLFAVLLVVAGATSRRRNARMLAGGLMVVAVLAFTPLPHALLGAVVPGYARFRGTGRWIGVAPSFALPLAALGLDEVVAASRRARRVVALSALTAVVVVAVWLVRESLVASAPFAYLARHGALAVTAVAVAAACMALSGRTSRRPLAAACALVAFDVVVATRGWFPSNRVADAYPKTPLIEVLQPSDGRVLRVGRTSVGVPLYLPPNVLMVDGVADVQGITPYFPRDVDRYLRTIDDYGDEAREFNVAPPLRSVLPDDEPLIDRLDVGHVVTPVGDAPPPAGAVVDGGIAATARPGGTPATLVAHAIPVPAADQWRELADGVPVTTALVDGLTSAVTSSGAGHVTKLPSDPSTEVFDVMSPGPGFLRISARFAPGWRATVGGRPVEVHRTDGIFQGVEVPAGRSTVRLRYRDDAETRGQRIALVGGLITLVITAHPGRRRRHADDE